MKKKQRLGLGLALMLAMGGCFPMCGPGSVSGEIDGEALPGMASGLWFLDGDYEGLGYYIFMMLSVPNGCEAMAAQIEAQVEAQKALNEVSGDPDDLAAAQDKAVDLRKTAHEEHFGDETFWVVTQTVATEKVEGLAEKEVDLVETGYVSEDGDVSVGATKQEGMPDFEKVIKDYDLDAAKTKSYFHKTGKLTFGGIEKDGMAGGAGDAKMQKIDPDDPAATLDAGEIEFDFNVAWCQPAADAAKKWRDL
jgi:hypothetical protein